MKRNKVSDQNDYDFQLAAYLAKDK